MKNIKKNILIAIIGIGILCIILYITILNNVSVLFEIADGSDKPSAIYYCAIEKIYRLSEKKNIEEKILENIAEDKKKHLHDLYVQVLGILGKPNATIFLIKGYADYQNDKNRRSSLYYIIDSLGAIGNIEAVPFLEKLLSNYNKLDVQVTKYSIVRSLYLLTGKTYNYVDSYGKEATMHVTSGLINARKVIEDSKGRSRTFDEMMEIDRLYRPPEWKAS